MGHGRGLVRACQLLVLCKAHESFEENKGSSLMEVNVSAKDF